MKPEDLINGSPKTFREWLIYDKFRGKRVYLRDMPEYEIEKLAQEYSSECAYIAAKKMKEEFKDLKIQEETAFDLWTASEHTIRELKEEIEERDKLMADMAEVLKAITSTDAKGGWFYQLSEKCLQSYTDFKSKQ